MSSSNSRSNGFKWLGFTAYIPFIHTRVCWPELLQGILVAAATALALVPVLTAYFGLSFEEAVLMALIQSFLISLSWMAFGEPYASGWLTPALPLVLALILSDDFATAEQRIQMMTAIMLDFSLLLAVLGVTGLGAKLIRVIPEVLKGAVILGAALAAFIKVFDISVTNNLFNNQPYAATTAIVLSLVLAFSAPLHRLGRAYPNIARLISFGLLPGFVMGGVVGYFTGELKFDIQSGFIDVPLQSLLAKVSPFAIGFPSVEMLLQGLPIALIGYILFFGDLLTGDAVIEAAQPDRPDEVLDINHSRTHISMAIRNFLCSIVVPFFPTQGVLWTGIHVVLIQRWREGPKAMRSFYDGVSSYYVFGAPVLFLVAPVITGIKPLMPIALAVTLALTGFACAYIAMEKAKDNAERGAMFIGAVFLALLEPWLGLLLAVVAVWVFVDFKTPSAQPVQQAKPDADQDSPVATEDAERA